MPTCSLSLRNDDIKEFDSKWMELFSMTKIPPDDILEGLYKLRRRESEKLKTVLELYNLEIQEKAGPDYHRLKTTVKRSIESDIHEIWILAPESEIMKETPWSRIRGQNSVDKDFLDIVGNGEPTCSVLKETFLVSVTISISVQKWHTQIHLEVLSCSRVKEKHREPRSPRGKSLW